MLHVIYFEPSVNSLTLQDLYFPVLSRPLSFNFQDFPGPEKSATFQDIPRCVGTLDRLRELDECFDVMFYGELILGLAAQCGRSHWRR